MTRALCIVGATAIAITVEHLQAIVSAETQQAEAGLGRVSQKFDGVTDSAGRARDALGRFVKTSDDTGASASRAASGMDKAAASAKNVEGTAHAGGNALERMGGFFTHAASTAIGFAAGAVVFNGLSKVFDGAGDALIGFNSKMQNASVGMESMLGSADKAKALLSDLATFARTTPFEFPELVQSSQKLLAFGFAAEDIIPIMKSVGDATAAMGNVSGAALDRVTLALGQIAAKGRVQGDELLQLTEAGINGLKILADGFGVSTAEMQKMVEKGLVPADRALKLLIEGMENRAPNAMEKMATTWTGATSNIKDSLTQLLAGGFKPLFDALTDGANRFATFLMTPQVQAFARVVSQALAEIMGGIKALFSGDFARAGEIFADMGRVAAAGLIQILDAAVQAIPQAVQVLATLAGAAAEWGFNLVASFGQGMLAAAGAVLTAVMNEIVSAISAFIQSFSPPKAGPLKDIEIWGQNLIETYLHAMTKADFGILDDVMGAIKDILTSQVNLGTLPKEGLIPALIGSEAVVAQALDQLRTFGSISDDVFGQLDQFLGDAGAGVADLVRGFIELAGVEQELEGLNKQLDDLERQVKEETRAWEEAKRPIDDQIRSVERLYDAKLRSSDRAVSALERELRAQQALRRDQEQAITDAQKDARLGVEQLRLDEAQGAVARRRAEAEKDVAAATRRVRDAQESLNDARTKKGGADPRQVRDAEQRLQEAQLGLVEKQNDLARAGIETAKDRLDILNAQEAVMRSQIDVDTRGTQNAIQNAKDEKDAITRQKEDALDPLNAAMDELNEKHRESVRALEDQIAPLEAQRDRLTEQRDAMQGVLDLELTRLDHARELSDMYRQQLDLLNQMATAAAGAGGGAGGGAKGGAGGLGALKGGGSIAGGLGLKPIELPKIDEGAIAAMAEGLKAKLALSIDTAIQDLKGDIEASFKKVWGGIDWGQAIPIGIGAAIGGAVGLAITGSPFGALAGAAIGAAIGKGITEIDWPQWVNAQTVGASLAALLLLPITGPIGLIGGAAAVLFGDQLDAGLRKLGDIVGPAAGAVADFAMEQFYKIQEWWEKDGAEITAAAQHVWDTIFFAVQEFVEQVKVTVRDFLTDLEGFFDVSGKVLGGIVKVTWEVISTTIGAAIDLVTGAITALAKLINGEFTGAWNELVSTVAKVVTSFTGLIDNALNPVKMAAGDAATALTTKLAPAFDALREAAGKVFAPLDAVVTALKWLWDPKDFNIRVNIDIPDLPTLNSALNGLRELGNRLDPRDRKTLNPDGSEADTAGESPEDTINRAKTTDYLGPLYASQGIADPRLPAMLFSDIVGGPITALADDVKANTAATLDNTVAVVSGSLSGSVADVGPGGGAVNPLNFTQTTNASGITGLLETLIHLREGADVSTFGVSPALGRASSQFGGLQSTMPGTSMMEALGFRNKDAFDAWIKEINKAVQLDDQRRNPVNDAVLAALGEAGSKLSDAALNIAEKVAPALTDAADKLTEAGFALSESAADIDRSVNEKFDAFADAEKEKKRREAEGIPAFAGGIDRGPMKSDGYAYLHGDEWVVNSPAQARQLAATYGGTGGGGTPASGTAAATIDYTRLAQALAQQPIVVQSILDGRVVSQSVTRRQGEDRQNRLAASGGIR